MKLSYGPRAREHVARGWARMYTYLSFASFFCFLSFFHFLLAAFRGEEDGMVGVKMYIFLKSLPVAAEQPCSLSPGN